MGVLAGLGLAASVSAAGAPLSRDDAKAIYELSGFGIGIESTLTRIARGIVESSLHFPAPYGEKMAAVAKRDINFDRVHEQALSQMVELVDTANGRAVREWFESPLGRQFTALELRSYSEEGQAEIAAYMRKFTENPPDETRIELIKELSAAVGIPEVSRLFARTLMLAIALGSNEVQPENKRATPEQLEKKMAPVIDNIAMSVESTAASKLLIIYRDLSDEDLRAYMDFIRSDAGLDFNGAVIETYREVFGGYAFGIGRDFGEAIRAAEEKKES